MTRWPRGEQGLCQLHELAALTRKSGCLLPYILRSRARLTKQCVHLVVGRNLKTEENSKLLFPALTQVHREREQDVEQKQMKTMRLGEERNVRKFLSNTVHFRWCSNLQRSQQHIWEIITKASPVFSSPQVQLFNILPSTSSEAQKNTVWIATGTTPFLILLSPIDCFSHGCD